MDCTESDDKGKMVSVKTAINMYGTNINGSAASMKTIHNNFSENSSSRMSDLHAARRDISQYKESIRTADLAKAKAESELSGVKKTLKDLRLMIEKSNLKLNSEKKDIEALQKTGNKGVKVAGKSKEKFDYEGLSRELDLVKQELSKVKLDMASVIEEKTRAEKEITKSSSKLLVLASSANSLRKQIEEVNEEQVLVELARIEALKEFADIEARRQNEEKELALRLQKTRGKVEEMIEEVQKSKEYETKLAVALSDVNVLQNKLVMVKEMGSSGESQESESPALLEIGNEELETAKNELNTVREEGFQYMRSMDTLRYQLSHMKHGIASLEKVEKKTNLAVEILNSKLLRAKSKLETASANEEKAQTMLNNLTLALEKLHTQRDTANREKEVIRKEVAVKKAEIRQMGPVVDKTEASLKLAMQELEEVETAENIALDRLKTLIENAMRQRESAAQHSRLITMSKFEYEYLTKHAASAEEIAEKKIAAAHAWVEALRASEKEILMKTDIAQKQMQAEVEVSTAGKLQLEKKETEGDLEHWKQKCEKDGEKYTRQTWSKIRKSKGNLTPRRPKLRKSASPTGGIVSSFPIKRKKVMPNLTKFFSGKTNMRNM